MTTRRVCMGLGSGLGLAAAMGTVCAGCGSLPGLPKSESRKLASGRPYVFAPTTVEISPLTRIEPGPDGQPVLAVYLRLIDEWGDGTKALAVYNIQLFRVAGTSGVAEREDGWEWNVDLTDPSANSGWFDVTGMYRIPLDGVPAWAVEPQRPDEVMRLRVYVNTIGPDGETIVPQDSLDKVVTPWTGV